MLSGSLLGSGQAKAGAIYTVEREKKKKLSISFGRRQILTDWTRSDQDQEPHDLRVLSVCLLYFCSIVDRYNNLVRTASLLSCRSQAERDSYVLFERENLWKTFVEHKCVSLPRCFIVLLPYGLRVVACISLCCPG